MNPTILIAMQGDLRLSPTGYLFAAIVTIATFALLALLSRADRK